MKYLVVLVISVFSLFQSCNKIAQSTEVSFIEVNALLIDSINTLQLENSELFKSLTVDQSKNTLNEDLVRIRNFVSSLNNSIIEVKDHVVNSSKHTSDKEAVQQILLEENTANLLLKLADQTRDEILRIGSLTELQKNEELPLFPNIYRTPEDERWDEYHFKAMPLYAVVPIMNKWILNNERFVNGLLVKR